MWAGYTIYSGIFKVKSKRPLSLVWLCLIVHSLVPVSHPKDLAPLPCDGMGSRRRETQNAEGKEGSHQAVEAPNLTATHTKPTVNAADGVL